jgi:hypothetical protein
MKYVNKSDKYIKESTSNIDFALSKIKEQFSEEDVQVSLIMKYWNG